jgi:hypothetical protein
MGHDRDTPLGCAGKKRLRRSTALPVNREQSTVWFCRWLSKNGSGWAFPESGFFILAML